jgi:arylsulfatase A-like enzyme
LLTLVSLCFGGRAAAAQAPLNVLMVFWDTARYDHTTPAGYARNTTPNLAAFAANGIFFTDAFSQSDWTVPAVASLFTGSRPSSHGVLGPGDRLPEEMPTLAGLFKDKGFDTAVFGTGILGGWNGLTRGFGTFRNTQADKSGNSSILLPEEAAIDWLKERRGRPFFLLVHGLDAHYPYTCPQARRRLFADKAYAGPVKDLAVGYEFIAAFDRYREPDLFGKMSVKDWDLAQKVRSTREDLADLTAQYDGCLSYADSLLPRLTGTLTELGLDKNTIVIVFSDHGESLGGHGGYGHLGRPLYNEVQHIILAMRLPGAAAGRRISEPVELIDLMPTLAGLQGWTATGSPEGRDLAGFLRGGKAPPEPVLWASAASRPSAWPKRLDLQALRYGEWKALRDPKDWKLYNLKSDPGEKRDLRYERPEVFLDMASRLLSLSIKEDQAAAVNAAPSPADPGNEREFLALAGNYEQRGDLGAAEKSCRAGLAAFPNETGLYDILAKIYFRESRWDELAALRREQVKDEAGAPAAQVVGLAGALVSAGRYDEAEAVLRRADPGGRTSVETDLLRDRLALAGRMKISGTEKPAAAAGNVSFASEGKIWTVSRPPWILRYSAPEKQFSLRRAERPAAQDPESLRTKAALAASLLDHVEGLRFAAAPAAPAPADGLMEKLRAAGYVADN